MAGKGLADGYGQGSCRSIGFRMSCGQGTASRCSICIEDSANSDADRNPNSVRPMTNTDGAEMSSEEEIKRNGVEFLFRPLVRVRDWPDFRVDGFRANAYRRR